MVTNIATGGNPHLPAMQTALEKLRKPREKTEAETKLDEVLSAMKRSAENGGAEAARQKLERIKAKLKMLELAAGSAAASGDAKAARAVARQIQQAAKEMADALRGAGGGSGGAGSANITPGVGDASAQSSQLAAIKEMDADNPDHVAQLNGGTLAEGRKADAEGRATALLKIKQAETALQAAPQKAEEKDKAEAAKGADDLKGEARSLLAQMRKILEQARLALYNPLAKKQDAANAHDDFRQAEQALAGLNAASLGATGIDVSV
ncbi:hypothetical protein [Ferrovibrio sp.]|uniref:hypothetical protein n=1 Tax=Ferrovibrio sp. TaxID=1917215 RepID=UPI0035B1D37D